MCNNKLEYELTHSGQLKVIGSSPRKTNVRKKSLKHIFNYEKHPTANTLLSFFGIYSMSIKTIIIITFLSFFFKNSWNVKMVWGNSRVVLVKLACTHILKCFFSYSWNVGIAILKFFYLKAWYFQDIFFIWSNDLWNWFTSQKCTPY